MATRTVVKTKKQAVVRTHAEKPDDQRNRMIHLIESIEENWFHFSLEAVDVYDARAWEKWGYEKVQDYCKEDLNGLDYRIFMWRVQMGRTIKACNITPEAVSGLGWSKFKELCYIIKPEMSHAQIVSFIAKAKGMSFRDLQTWVQNERTGEDGTPANQKNTLKFRVNQDQFVMISSVLDQIKEVIKTGPNEVSDDMALDYLAMFYAAKNDGTPIAELLKAVVGRSSAPAPKVKHKKHEVQKKTSKKKLTKKSKK